jgi:transposase
MRKTHVVRLSREDRQALEKVVNSGAAAARKITRARILLKADVNGEGCTDRQIVEALGVGDATVERVRKRFVQGGLGAGIEHRPSPPRPAKRRLDGDGEAHLIALACGQPPAGRPRWTLQLLADRMVKLKWADEVSYETVRRTLKKMSLNRG